MQRRIRPPVGLPALGRAPETKLEKSCHAGGATPSAGAGA